MLKTVAERVHAGYLGYLVPGQAGHQDRHLPGDIWRRWVAVVHVSVEGFAAPKTEEEFRARVEVFVQTYPSELTNDDERRQDIRHPFVKDDESLRLIWGPWEPAEERATWTAYDAAYVEQSGKNIHEAVANLSAMRERSRRYCDGLEGVWLALEREDYKRTTTVDESIRLWQIRKQQSECRYWRRQVKQIETQ
ncbi:MAG: hypothetical protein ACFNXZ_10900 [Lautropia mirabilis]